MSEAVCESRNTTAPATLAFSATFYLILVGHFAVDTYSAIVPAILNKLELRFHLSNNDSAWLLALGSLCSGLAQPLFGWFGKRMNTIIFIGVGILLAAICIPLIELVPNRFQLFRTYMIGMVGVGIFHPVAASAIGSIDPARRSLAISWFFVAGMLGGITGALLGPLLITQQIILFQEFQILGIRINQFVALAIPGMLIVAPILYVTKQQQTRNRIRREMISAQHDSSKLEQRAIPYRALTLLYLAAVVRFFVNVALIYLFVRLASQHFETLASSGQITAAEVGDRATQLTGRLQAFMIAGMAIGGLAAGILIKPGQEKLPLMFVPLVFAPIVAGIPFQSPDLLLPIFCLLAGVGFASMVPVTISLAQRLLPQNTSLASGMMLGGAWAFAMGGPPFASILMENFGIQISFIVVAVLLGSTGLLVWPANLTIGKTR